MPNVWRRSRSMRPRLGLIARPQRVADQIAAEFWEAPSGPTYSGILKRWTGAAWVKAKLMRYNGATWVAAKLMRWTGAAWVQVDATGV